MEMQHDLLHCIPLQHRRRTTDPRSSVPQTLLPGPQEASARKIRPNFDERLQSRCSQPHGNACEFPPPRRTTPHGRRKIMSLKNISILREAPWPGGIARRAHKHTYCGKGDVTHFPINVAPLHHHSRNKCSTLAGPCQRLFTSTNTCS